MSDLEIFLNAPDDLSPQGLRSYLDEACGSDRELRKRVESLFAADARAADFLGEEIFESGASGEGQAEGMEGTTIGGYRLLQKIGEGGFGVVYMADQLEPVKRRVALKIIKLGMDTKQVVARFEVERQALAMMDHPNMAKVFDAGATEMGRPYLVMDLVRGLPITEFCEGQKLDIRERLELFIDVCGAIQHAHQKGIIHRDLKPSNVIVTIHDDKAVPKVIDFGVAKATQQDLTEKTLFTRFEQFIGTPAYMSPEQCQMGGLDIDTRSDIYSLGVLLYELLTGTTPIDAKALAGASQEELRRVIREEEPPTPSTRSSRQANRANTVQDEKRLAVPLEIDRELDWIVMKALEKDRTRRYDTSAGLAADVRRHLQCEPVEAGPPGVAYRIGKLVRRHRAAVFTSAAMLALLIGGITTSTWQWLRASQSEAEVTVERDRARDNEEEAKRERLVAKHQMVEGLFAEDKVSLGIAHLAQLVREDPGNRVAGERLMSALRRHPIPKRISPLLAKATGRKAVSPSGEYLVSFDPGVTSGHGVHRTDGWPSGFPIIPSLENLVPSPRVAFNPKNGRQVIVASDDQTDGYRGGARTWDIEQNEPIGSPMEFRDSMREVGFSPDGSLVIAAASSRDFQVQSTEPARGIDWRKSVELRIEAVTFSPDSRLVAVATREGQVTVWDAMTGRQTMPTLVHDSPVWAIAFNPASDRLITGNANGVAEIWDLRTGKSTGVRIGHASDVRAVEFSPDGRGVLTGSQEGALRVWDVGSGLAVTETMELGGNLMSAHFDQSGARVVAATYQQFKVWSIASPQKLGGTPESLQLRDVFFEGEPNQLFACDERSQRWVIRNGRPLCRIFRHSNVRKSPLGISVNAARFGRNGDLLLTSGRDSFARLWDINRAEELKKFPGFNVVPWAELSPDNTLAVTASHSWAILWDVAEGKEIKKLRRGSFQQAVFSPVRDEHDRWRVATISGGKGACVQIWNGETGEPLGSDLSLAPGVGPRGLDGRYGNLQFSQDGKRLAAFDGQKSVLLWGVSGEPDEWVLVRKFSHEGTFWGFDWSRDEKRLVLYGRDDRLLQWDVETGELYEPVVAHSNGMVSARYDPSGGRIVTASGDKTARIWDAATFAPIGVPLRHDGVVILAVFSPDGRRVVTTSIDGTGRVWDAETGFPLSEPLRHDGVVLYAEFSHDGRKVVTAGWDSTARVWDVPPAPDGVVPDWVAGWAEALVGLRIDEDGNSVRVPWEEAQLLEDVAQRHGGEGFYERTVSWYYENPARRSITPFCEYSVPDYVDDRLDEKDPNGLPLEGSLEEVLRIDPHHAEAMAKLAELLLEVERGNKSQDLARARYLSHLAASLDSTNADYAELAARVEKELEANDELEDVLATEARAREDFQNGNQGLAQSLMDHAALQRIRMTAADRWPDEQERADFLARLMEVQSQRILVGKGARWRYFDRPDSSVPADWKEPGFQDGNWQEGRAPLGFSKNGEDGEVTRLENGPEGAERVAFYFRHRFSYSPDEEESDSKVLVLSLRRDDGAVIYLNGEELLRSNMPDGEVDEHTLAASTAGEKKEKEYHLSYLESTHLREGENVLAVEVHEVKPGSSDIGFDLEMLVGENPVGRFRDGVFGEEMDAATRARVLWVLGDKDSALGALDSIDVVLEPLVGSSEPAEVRLRKEWLRRKADVLGSLGRTDEAWALRGRVAAVWERAPGTPAGMVDLSDVYNRGVMGRYAPAHDSANYWMERLPETFDAGDGPGFDIRGSVRLNSGVYGEGSGAISGKNHNRFYGTDFGMSVRIAIGQAARVVHFLHGCDWGAAQPGEVVATYVVHFDGGSSESVPVRYGEDILADWIHALDPLENEALGALVWEKRFRQDNQQNGRVGYVVMRWENARQPEKEITHIDFLSGGKQAAPYLLGVTLE